MLLSYCCVETMRQETCLLVDKIFDCEYIQRVRMCRHCVRTPFPDRDRMCLETGAFLANLSRCKQCRKNSLTSEPLTKTNTTGGESDSEDSDTECLENEGELVSYNHVCTECRHLVSAHKVILTSVCWIVNKHQLWFQYKFWVEEGRQEYRMNCLLCGVGEDSVSVMPHDPRKASRVEC